MGSGARTQEIEPLRHPSCLNLALLKRRHRQALAADGEPQHDDHAAR
ncbi:MAG: hypothetical protein QNL88_07000 [Acidobacteriota bacterium]|nr:hypothetical protein [Acidobacteriota bacterium]